MYTYTDHYHCIDKLNLKGSKYTMEILIQLILSGNFETHPPTSLPLGETEGEETVLPSGTAGKLA